MTPGLGGGFTMSFCTIGAEDVDGAGTNGAVGSAGSSSASQPSTVRRGEGRWRTGKKPGFVGGSAERARQCLTLWRGAP